MYDYSLWRCALWFLMQAHVRQEEIKETEARLLTGAHTAMAIGQAAEASASTESSFAERTAARAAVQAQKHQLQSILDRAQAADGELQELKHEILQCEGGCRPSLHVVQPVHAG